MERNECFEENSCFQYYCWYSFFGNVRTLIRCGWEFGNGFGK